MTATVRPSAREEFSIAASTYQKQGNNGQLLFTPFSLSPGDEWSNHVSFWNPLARHIEKRVKDTKAALRKEIRELRELRSDEEKEKEKAVFADSKTVAPLLQLFDEQFKWHPDDYEVSIAIATEPPNAFRVERFRFVLFESDTAELQAVTENYSAGAGVFFPDDTDEGVMAPVQKIKNN